MFERGAAHIEGRGGGDAGWPCGRELKGELLGIGENK